MAVLGACPVRAQQKQTAGSLSGYVIAPVESFHYQLQKLDIEAASTSPFPVLITDYSLDGTESQELTPSQVAQLKTGGRIVLAYLSIGEAEAYRFYFDPAWIDKGENDPDRPPFLGPRNPDFPDNFKVRYWDPAWPAIIFGSPEAYLDRILAQGFDGVYLDIIDAFEFFGPEGNNERPTAREDMIDFVKTIAAYGRNFNPAFSVVPQNGTALVEDATYLDAISGIGAEDTWFDDNRRQKKSHTSEVVPWLDSVRKAGKAVFSIDYATQRKKIDEFFNLAEAKGYAAYSSGRDLDRMNLLPQHPPSSGPTVVLTSPADGAAVSRTTPPTFTWSASGAVFFELQFSARIDLTTRKRSPLKKNQFISDTVYMPTNREWKRIVKLAGKGSTLHYWVVATDANGYRRSAVLRTLQLVNP
jgi:cysteinyl-tRNA synthetase